MAIPSFNTNGNLPAGIHLATWQEVEETLAFNPRRRELLSGLKRGCKSLKEVGCLRIFISGSLATNKELPGDFDVCWADETVDLEKLAEIDPVLLDLTRKRAAQKAKYGGEFFSANLTEGGSMKRYLDFFQTDRNGEPKGIIAIEL